MHFCRKMLRLGYLGKYQINYGIYTSSANEFSFTKQNLMHVTSVNIVTEAKLHKLGRFFLFRRR